MREMILSVKRKYAMDILSGKKKYELRKVCIDFAGDPYVTAHLYATPTIGVIGKCKLYADYLLVEDNYSPVSLDLIGITQAQLEKYLRGRTGYLYTVADPVRYDAPIILPNGGPQMYSWATKMELAVIKKANVEAGS